MEGLNRGKSKRPRRKLDFTALVDAIRRVHEESAAAASRAVNVSLQAQCGELGHEL